MTSERTTGTRKSSTSPAHPSQGVVGLAVAWKVAAVLPLVLTGAVLAGRVDLGSDDPATSRSSNQVVVDSGTPDVGDDTTRQRGDKGDTKGDRDRRDKASPSDSPSAEATSAPPTLSPSSSPTADPTDPDPTKSPTKSPTKTPQPSPTPTPSEAEDMCREAGVNPLDLAAMADCIADILNGE